MSTEMVTRHAKPGFGPVEGDVDEVCLLRAQLTQLQAALRTHAEAQRVLEESEARYRQLFEHVHTGVYRLSLDGHLLQTNPAFLRMFALPDYERYTDFPLQNLYVEPSDRERFIQEVERNGQIENRETTYRACDGRVVYVRESLRAVRGPDGKTLHYEGVVENLTPLRRYESLGRSAHYILRLVGENKPVDEILNQIAEMLASHSSGSASLVYRRGSEAPVLAATCKLPRECAGAIQGHRYHALNDAAVTGRITVIRDLREVGTDGGATLRESGYACSWSVPILSAEEAVLGCLTVLQPVSREPTTEEFLSLETAARIAAVAIEQHQLFLHLDHRSNYDALTELPNRRLLQEALEIALGVAEKHGTRVGLLFVDLDHFKLINERYGHRQGDTFLKNVASLLESRLPPGVLLARLGGDEFAMLVPTVHSAAEVTELAENTLRLLGQGVPSAPEFSASASIGIAIYPDDASDCATMQRHADTAMYVAKSRGRNAYQRYQHEEVRQNQRRAGVEQELRQALKRGELQLYYQPQVDAAQKLVGFEALLRWNHPRNGLLTPGDFIAVAEDSGLIIPMGAWAIEEAIRQCSVWLREGTSAVPISVNVSALQLQGTSLPDMIERRLRRYAVSPDLLIVELTESVVMRNSAEATIQLQALQSLGMKIAIDDFGTGYSSLSYLQQLPMDILKIDRCFVEPLGRNDDRANAVVRAIIALARTFDLGVIAEGVETREQFNELCDLGVDVFQGYLFGRPLPIDQLSHLLSPASPAFLS